MNDLGHRPHLPDCSVLQEVRHAPCNCGRPLHPLPPNRAIVRREGKLREVARSKVARGERDYNESRLEAQMP